MVECYDSVSKTNLYKIFQNILNYMIELDHNCTFYKPIDPEYEECPDYYEKVATPMCFKFIQTKIDNKEYNSSEEFAHDMRIIFLNAKDYNSPATNYYRDANNLLRQFEMQAGQLPRAIDEADKQSDLQRLIELRFKRYQYLKGSHE